MQILKNKDSTDNINDDHSIKIGNNNKFEKDAVIGHGSRIEKNTYYIQDKSQEFETAPPNSANIEVIAKILLKALGFKGSVIVELVALVLTFLGIPIGMVSVVNMPSNQFTQSTPIGLLPTFPKYGIGILILGFIALVIFIVVLDALIYYRVSRCESCGRDFALFENQARKVRDVDAVDAVYRVEKHYTECRYCHNVREKKIFFEYPKSNNHDDEF